MENRLGKFAQNLTGKLAYKSFRPSSLPPKPQIEIGGRILDALLSANRKIAYLNGCSSRMPKINRLEII